MGSIPEMIGPFRPLSILGRGGMSVVYHEPGTAALVGHMLAMPRHASLAERALGRQG